MADVSEFVDVLNLNCDSGPEAAFGPLYASISDNTLIPGVVVSDVLNSILPNETSSQSPTFKLRVSVSLITGELLATSSFSPGLVVQIQTLPPYDCNDKFPLFPPVAVV